LFLPTFFLVLQAFLRELTSGAGNREYAGIRGFVQFHTALTVLFVLLSDRIPGEDEGWSPNKPTVQEMLP
jgi:hypothetical protein